MIICTCSSLHMHYKLPGNSFKLRKTLTLQLTTDSRLVGCIIWRVAGSAFILLMLCSLDLPSFALFADRPLCRQTLIFGLNLTCPCLPLCHLLDRRENRKQVSWSSGSERGINFTLALKWIVKPWLLKWWARLNVAGLRKIANIRHINAIITPHKSKQ